MKRRPDAVTVLSIYHFLVAALLIGAMCMALAMMPYAFYSSYGYRGVIMPIWSMALIAIIPMLFMAAFVAAGVGLIRMEAWGRWVAIALAILSLPLFPLGSIAGGLTLWYLLMPETRELFEPPAPVAEE